MPIIPLQFRLASHALPMHIQCITSAGTVHNAMAGSANTWTQ
jgi:hypothetical protein